MSALSDMGYYERLDEMRWERGHDLAIFRDENGFGPLWMRGMRWSYGTSWLWWRWRVWEGCTGRPVGSGRAFTFRNAVWAAERAAGA